ncbi:MAG: hypothetical protein ACJ75B_02715 [Flavisolibacter sp.]
MNLHKHGTKISALAAALFMSLLSMAQDKATNVDINVNKGGGNWYTQPWVWIVGGAIFILLLVALLRGSGNRND